MKRKAISIPLLILFLSICLSNAHAKPVDTLVAKHVALNFMAAKTQNPSRSTPTAQLIYTGTYQNSSTSRSANCFYIFSTSNGFVIVSADDRIEPILGYSTEGRIDLHGMPVNMEEILDGYTQEIKLFLQNATPEPNAATEKWRHLADNTYMIHEKAAVIGPLLKTRWNQSSPYNLHCPDSNGQGLHALTGCVATAMAQIIRYWEYPAQGVGTKTYTCNNASSSNNYYGDYGTLTVNFGIGSYNYNYMPEVIDNNSSSAQINAVARLSYHCGVSVQMTYGINASAASTSNAVNALSNYFKYSSTYNTLTPEFKSKSNYSDADWVNMIKSELNAWRPVIYSGSGTGGHAFICDGYDNQGYYHFNWGWGGYLDGYFLLTALTPTGHNYTLDQAAIFYIQGRTPLIRTSSDELSFIAPIGNHSNSQILSLCGVALSNNIVASVPAGFQISTDNIQYGNSLTLGTGVSQVYIRYAPTIATIGVENAVLTLSSGSTTKTIALTGRTYDLDCNPPQNLQGSAELQDVQLSWQAPTQDIHTYTFSLDSSVNYGRRVGFGVTSYTMVNRLCEPELIPYHQKLLNKISFYVIPASYTSYKIVVYRGGKYQNGGYSEGTLVLEQSANITSSGWNTVTLNSPVVIDAEQELWYGVLLNCPSNAMPIPVGTNPAIVGQGDLVRINGSWLKLSNFNGYEYNIPFKISIEDSPAAITNYTIERNNTPVGTTTGTQFHEQQNTSGAYTYNVTANWDNGCSATSEDIVITVATDCIATTGDTTASVCNSFDWYEHSNITNSGNYSHTIVNGNANGCDSIVTLHLTVNQAVTASISATACENYTWNGQTYTKSGNYTQTFTAANGCDSVVTLHLTINHAVTASISATACESYIWNGQTYTKSGNYTQTFTAANGCDSVVTLHLTINHAVTSNISATACENYTWNGQIYTTSGNYTQTFTAANGCDSVVTLHLTINHAVTASISATACESYIWNGQTYTKSGNYTQTFTAANGCDSVVTLHLTINHAVTSNISATACENYTWNGQIYTTSGNYTQTFTAANGCDSVVTLHLTINHAMTASISVTACESYSWNGQTYTQSGHYTQTFTAANGCDSVVTLHLTINQAVTASISATACENYTWNGQTYTKSGNYTQTFTAANGCDSVVTLHLTINHAVTSNISATACESYSWNGQTYTQSGHYTQTFTAANGCDSVVTLHLTINHAVTSNISATACESYSWNGQTYTQSGHYTQTFTAANGCDSVVTLHLTINHAVTASISVTACESYSWNGQTYTQSGNYTQTFTAANGCDSVVTLHLTINHAVTASISVTACESYSWNGQTYTQSGHYTQTFTAANGCDSVVTLHLTINHAVTASISVTACESYSWNGQTYTQSGHYTQTFTAANGCDSVVTLHLTINHAVTANISATACESHTWNGQTYTQSGNYTQTFTAANGCDSVVTLHLTINHAVTANIPAIACESYIWNGQTYTQSGNYTQTFTAANDCDSVVTLHLTVNHAVISNISDTACENYTWNRQTYTQSGNYTQTFTAANGCDSVVTLHLTINHAVTANIPATACESHTWNGQTYTQSGNYTQTFTAANGCDSVVTLHLTINHAVTSNISATACESYIWNGQTYTQSGNYTQTFTAANDCDSVVTLHLTVNHAVISNISDTACENYTWNRQTYTQSGNYTQTFTAANGCDSVVTLHLTINQRYYIPENITVTQGSLPYHWHGRTFYASATAYDSLTSGAGCDSVHFLNLTVTPFNIVEDEPIAFCQGDSQTWRGRTLTQAGDYRDTVLAENTIYTVVVTVNPTYYIPENITVTQGRLPYLWHGRAFYASTTAYDSLTSGAGCDSVHFLNLSVTPFNIVEDEPIAFCQGNSQTWRGRTLTQAGEYRDTVLTENTIHTVVVTVNPTYYIPENITVTQGSLPYHWHGRDFYESATAYDSLTSVAGCDSVYFLNLTVTPFNIVEDEPIAFCQGDSQIWRGRTLSQAGEYRDTVLTENTIYTVVVTVNPTYYIPENVTVTQGSLPYLWHGRDFYESATAYDSLTSGAGCDSVHFLNLSVTAFNIVEDEPIAFCQGNSQTWRGRTLTQAGEYRDTVLTENTIYTVVVTVNPTYYIPENVTVTQGSLPYHWHGRDFYESATAYDSLTSTAGCDSVHFLNLDVTPFSIVADESIAFCQGESQTWRGRTLTQAGDYRDTVLAENTIYTVVVTVNPTYYIPENITVTQGSLPYRWHGRDFYESATAYDSLTSGAGCDSVHFLNLTVTPFNIVEDEPIAFCQGDSQTWRGRTLSQAGEYRDTVLAENTIYTVVVIVNPTYAVDTTVTITTNDLPYHFVSGQIDTTFEEGTPDLSTVSFHLSTLQECDSVITLHLTIVTGIAQHPMAQALRAFPNPTSGLLTVTGDTDFTQLQLFDAYGRKIGTYSVDDNQIEIDLHGLANGVYFIKAMRHKQMIGTLRIIKNGL